MSFTGLIQASAVLIPRGEDASPIRVSSECQRRSSDARSGGGPGHCEGSAGGARMRSATVPRWPGLSYSSWETSEGAFGTDAAFSAGRWW
ncbi:hypothetical protein AAFF_G00064070 [Aldrovandia affinis]|uniref:Uncharacterized protein n=1 Tax=Aldrovandia affinis TaxID=143900 RepID=A0AAD7T3K6_9TELE|nr:hypothetical protein AAFF_G00064070 [Aldrovandia affinis]